MGADEIAVYNPALREMLEGGGDWCAAFTDEETSKCWVQVTSDCINFSYPFPDKPKNLLRKRGATTLTELKVLAWKPRKWATLAHEKQTSREIAVMVDELLHLVLGRRDGFRITVELYELAAKTSTRKPSKYPAVVDPRLVGTYPASAHAGGSFVWDAVLEYRVWCHPKDGGDDWYHAFASYEKALTFSRRTKGAEKPLALIVQEEHINEPKPGRYVHVKERRITEWPVEFLSRPRRKASTIPDFMSPDAPSNRLDILRGKGKPPRVKRRRS